MPQDPAQAAKRRKNTAPGISPGLSNEEDASPGEAKEPTPNSQSRPVGEHIDSTLSPHPYNYVYMNRTFSVAYAVVLAAGFLAAQSNDAPPTPEKIPVMDGAAGPCSLELTITGADGKPAFAATVKIHIAYGFGGVRRLDLEAGTNSDGNVKFTGLPARVRRPPLEFQAYKDGLVGVATYDPLAECQAKHSITLQKSKQQAAHAAARAPIREYESDHRVGFLQEPKEFLVGRQLSLEAGLT